MSARPRPVTATIKPKCMQPVTGVRSRSYSLSSGSSTDSLVSILDHDSYESDGLESGDEQNSKSRLTEHNSAPVANTNETITLVTTSESNKHKDPGVIAWEKWMITKAKDTRLKQKRALCQQKRKQDEAKRLAEEKKQKQAVCERKLQEWMDNKHSLDRLRNKSKVRQEMAEKDIKEAKEQAVKEKAEQKYNDWKLEKKKIEKELAMKKDEEEKKKQEEKTAQEEKSKKAFDEWCEKAKTRPKSARCSMGYTAGKLTGYYDSNAYQVPKDINPPWMPVAMPQPIKKKKVRSKSAKRWNPDKYF